jgi:hypothetical protein
MPQKFGRARASTQLHIGSPSELVGFWAMNKLKVNWGNDTCKLIMRHRYIVNLGLFWHFETITNIRTWIKSHRYWRML